MRSISPAKHFGTHLFVTIIQLKSLFAIRFDMKSTRKKTFHEKNEKNTLFPSDETKNSFVRYWFMQIDSDDSIST